MAALFGEDPRPRHPSELAHELGLPIKSVQLELRRLMNAGLVRVGALHDRSRIGLGRGIYKRPYSADPASPVFAELRRMTMQIRGAAAFLRPVLAVHPTIRAAWIHGRYAHGGAKPGDPLALAVIGPPQRRLDPPLRTLEPKLGRRIDLTAMSREEWITRLDKREMVACRLRAGPKLWVIGNASALRGLEQDARSSRDNLRQFFSGDEWKDWPDWTDEDVEDGIAGEPGSRRDAGRVG